MNKRHINNVVTHLNPHLDEYLAIHLVKTFGQYKFQTIGLTYGYLCTTVNDPELESKNPTTLFLGVGRGQFDDHGHQQHKSCCELMAEYLLVKESLSLMKVLETVSFHDKNLAKTPNPRTLPRTINLMHRYGYDPVMVMDWVEHALHALVQSEVRLLAKVATEVDQEGLFGELRRGEIHRRFLDVHRDWMDLGLKQIANTFESGGKEWLKFAHDAHKEQDKAFKQACEIAPRAINRVQSRFGEISILSIDGSDGTLGYCEVEFDAASRNRRVGADLVILRNSQGNTMIAANPTFKGNLTGFVKKLRIAEARKRGEFIPPQFQIQEGTVEEFPQWHVHEGIGYRRVYNGTATRPYVEPTVLMFDEINELILDWLAVNKFTCMPQGDESENSLEHAFDGTPLAKQAADAS